MVPSWRDPDLFPMEGVILAIELIMKKKYNENLCFYLFFVSFLREAAILNN